MESSSVREPLKTFVQQFFELRKRLDSLNQNSARDRNLDFEIMAEKEFVRCLQDPGRFKWKLSLALSQIGYLRINIFYEYYSQVQKAEKKGDLDQAVHLMNEYVSAVALPFILPRTKPSWFGRLQRKLPEVALSLQRWTLENEQWLEAIVPESKLPVSTKQKEEYNHLKNSFISLHSLSFTYENFPPIAGTRDR